MVALNFNANQYEPKYGGGGGLPAGKYKGVIVNTSSQENKDKTGGYLALELTPIEGPFAGVKHTDRLNLWHPKPDAVDIANKQLTAYCHVVGVFNVADSQQLCNIPFMFEVGPQKDNPQYTQVVAIYDVNGNEPGKAGAGPQGGGAPPPGGGFPPQGGQGGFPPAGGAPPAGGGFPPQGQGGFPPAGGAPPAGGGFPPQGGGFPPGGGAPPGGGFPPGGGAPPAGNGQPWGGGGGAPPAGGAPWGQR